MNPGVGASLAAILDQIVAVHAQVAVDPPQSVAPEIAIGFLCLSWGNGGRGKRRVLGELD